MDLKVWGRGDVKDFIVSLKQIVLEGTYLKGSTSAHKWGAEGVLMMVWVGV